MKKKFLKILTGLCCVGCLATAGVGLASMNVSTNVPAAAYEVAFADGETMQEWYAYGSVFTAPSGSIDGVSATKTAIVFPDGTTYEATSLELSEEGLYTVIWYAEKDGRTVSAKKTFKVIKDAFTAADGATCSYVDQLATVTPTDKDGDGEADATGGLKVSFNGGGTFTYNKPVDLREASPFIDLHGYSLSSLIEGYNGTKIEASNFYITLTDCYDASKMVTITVSYTARGDGVLNVHLGANAVGQQVTACRYRGQSYLEEHPKINWTTLDGQVYQIYEKVIYAGPDTDEIGVSLYYDVEENLIKTTYGRINSAGVRKLYSYALTDLDDTNIYEKNAFEGFTTGEVYVSITADDFIERTANLEIESIGGVSGEALKSIEMKDTTPPTIKIKDELKNGAIVAVNETVEIPDATAYDQYLPYGATTDKAVYYAYDPTKTNNRLVGLKNGCFTPTTAGAYTLVYTATDKNGNVGTATVEIACIAAADGQALDLSVEESMTASAGTYATLPECNASGLYEEYLQVKTYAQFSGDTERIEVKDGKLFLEKVGAYTVTYEYTTPLKTYTASCIVTSEASDVITIDKPVLPEYFIKDAKYTLDTVYAYEYTATEPTKFVAETYLSADGGEYKKVDYENVLIDASNTVRFKYVRGDVATYSDEMPVVDVGFGGKLSQTSYFRFTDGELKATATNTGLTFESLTQTGDSTLTYINVLSASSFALKFKVLASTPAVEDDPKTEKDESAPAANWGTVSAIKITLIDYYDRSNVVTLSYINDNGVAAFSLNGGAKTSLSRNFLGNDTMITYRNGEFLDNKQSFAWNGSFTSDRILMRITMEGIEDNACLNIASLNGQTLNTATRDNGAPNVYIKQLPTGIRKFNEIVTFDVAQCTDVFSPFLKSNLTLSVQTPSGNYATTTDGVSLAGKDPADRTYAVQLTEYGVYMVSYRYVDQNGKSGSISYAITVAERELPTLTVDGVLQGEVIEAEYGEMVTIADYSASDAEGDVTSFVKVYSPLWRTVELDDGVFHANKKGDFTVIYYCYDAAGNYTTFSYIVRVR